MENIFVIVFFKIRNCYYAIIVAIQLFVFKDITYNAVPFEIVLSGLFFLLRLQYKKSFQY